MRRTYSRERYLALVERLRDAIPDLALGTDIIVGFPGETEDDFRETLEVVEEVGFDSAFTFVYSPRAGTEAAAMRRPGARGRQARADGAARGGRTARRAQRGTRRGSGSTKRCSSKGRAGRTPTLLRGRTRRNTTVNFAGAADVGELVEVAIEGATSTTLRGRARSLVAA